MLVNFARKKTYNDDIPNIKNKGMSGWDLE